MLLLILATAVPLAVLLGAALLPPTAAARLARNAAADMPVSFGFRMAWVALRSSDTAAVVAALRLEQPAASGWLAGITAVYGDTEGDSHVFVAPAIGGFTLAVGLALPQPAGPDLPNPVPPFLSDLGRRFQDVQYFFTEPEIGYFAWARVTGGVLVRAAAYADGALYWSVGAPGKEEQMLGLASRVRAGSNLIPLPAVALAAPCEDQVIALAGFWSLDPTTLAERNVKTGAGVLGRAPSFWRLPVVAPPPGSDGRSRRGHLRPVV